MGGGGGVVIWSPGEGATTRCGWVAVGRCLSCVHFLCSSVTWLAWVQFSALTRVPETKLCIRKCKIHTVHRSIHRVSIVWNQLSFSKQLTVLVSK